MNKARWFRYGVYTAVVLLLVSWISHLETLTARLQDTHTVQVLESQKERKLPTHHSDHTLMIDDSAAQALASRDGGRIMCFVLATAKNIDTKAAAVNSTWLRRCDGHIFFIEDVPAPVPSDVVSLNVPRGYYNLTAKVVIILQYLYSHHLHEYDWFLKGDDDAYVIVENLRYLVSRYNATDPVYLGQLYKRFMKEGYMSGGATYVLSREALRLVVEKGYKQNKCKTQGGHEDVEVGRCLHQVGVHSYYSRDRFGRDTFHPLRPNVHVAGPIPADQRPQDRFLMVSGDECCSQLMISFHKVDPSLMKVMDHLLYRTSVYGRVQDVDSLHDLIQPAVVPPLP